VVVDVVVHDKQQRPVGGLNVDDFEVWEDGKRQEITSFVRVDNADEVSVPTTTGTAAPRAPFLRHADDPPAVAALVFQELGPEARLLAMKAGSRFIEESVGSSGFAGIFSQDFALHVVTPFTNNRDALVKGLRSAAMKAEPTRDPIIGSPIMDCTSNPAGRPRTLEVFNQLRGIIAALGHLPGRKAIVLFSEGIDTKGWLCDDRHGQFQDLAADANRAHVAFYTFDAAGLRIVSTVRAAEAAPYVAMTMLAHETGGAFVESTNDLAPSMARIAADLRQYYLLGYTPAKAADDKYRTIEVKVKREGLSVLARKGYRASRDTDPAVVRPAEVPALLLLDEPKHAGSIPLLTRTLRMPEPDARGRVAVVASVPLDAVTFEAPEPSMPPAGRLTLLARVENKKADVVHYAAETYDFIARPRQSDATGSILFFTAAALPPEPLSVAVAAYDALGQKGTVHREPLDAPTEKSGDLLVGDLIVASQLRQRQSTTPSTTANGVPFGNVVLLPNLGEPVPAGPPLVAAFQAVADRSHGAFEATLNLKRDGAAVMSLPLRVPQPAADGLVRFATQFQTGQLQPGAYVLVLTVTYDKGRIERQAGITIEATAGSAVR
jgi:VWFA-related protein